MVSLKDVARHAGVSLGTASRVVNKKAGVKEENRLAVERAIAELGYQPNFIARSLKVRHSLTFGMLIPDISSPYYPDLVRGAEDEARKWGYSLLLVNTDRSQEREGQALQLLLEKQVDGLLYVSNTLQEDTHQALRTARCPVMLVSTRDYLRKELPSVSFDNCQGAMDATRHLLSLGHRRIALLAGPENDPNAGQPRHQGYCDALREAGIPVDDSLILWGEDYSHAFGYQSGKALLQRGKPPTAIFSVADVIAMGACKAILDAGLRIPRDIAVMGFDGLAYTAYTYPSLSTIETPRYFMGARAARALIDSIDGRQPALETTLPHRLLVRESTAPSTLQREV